MKKVLTGVVIWSVVLCGLPCHAVAQGLGLKGVGGRLGIVDPDVTSGTIGIGAHVDLGEISPNLVLYPGFDYWNKSGVSSFTLNGDLRYYAAPSPNFDLFFGGGLAISFLSFDAPRGRDRSDTEVGLNLLGGVDVPVSKRLVATGMLRFLISDPDALKITGGLTYLLGK